MEKLNDVTQSDYTVGRVQVFKVPRTASGARCVAFVENRDGDDVTRHFKTFKDAKVWALSFNFFDRFVFDDLSVAARAAKADELQHSWMEIPN